MSSEEAAFLAAIAADPDDRLPRYVYSDWLEDRGDERCFWVRDDALWPYMGPRVENPIPRLLTELSQELDRFAEFARSYQRPVLLEGWNELLDDSQVESRLELLGRCGPQVVPAIIGRLTDADPWPRIVQQLCLPFPSELIPSADLLTTEANRGRPEIAQSAACLLVRVCELQPERLDGVLMDVWRSGDPRTERAVTALRHARGIVADRTADSWIGHLTEDLTQPELDDLPLFLGKLTCLANMADVPPATQPLFEAALRDARPEVVESGSLGLRRLGEQVASETAEKAIRECTEHNRTGAFAVARAAWPDWVPRIVAMLKEPDLPEQTRLGAVECLEHVDQADWPTVLPVLRKGMTDKAEAMRRAAQLALARAKVPTEWVVLHLREARKEKSAKVRAEVVAALLARHAEDEQLPPPLLAEAMATFTDPRVEVCNQVASELGELGLGHLLAQEAQRLSRSPATDDRIAAARLLGYFSDYSDAGFPRLLDLFDDRELAVRRVAVQVVALLISPNASGVYKPLKRALRDPDAIIRGAAATAFGKLGKRSAELLPELLDLTRDSVPIARGGAVFAVGKIDIENEQVVRAVRRGLIDESEHVVRSALEGLEEVIYLDDPELLVRLCKLTAHPTPRIRELAFGAMNHYADEDLTDEAIDRGLTGLRDEDITVAEAAFQFLPDTPEVNRRAVPLYFRLYASPGCTIRESLGGTIRDLPDALPNFVRLFDHADEAVRMDAMAWMEDIAEREPERRAEVVRLVRPKLRERLTAERGKNLVQVIDLTATVGPPAVECLPLIEPYCRHDNPDLRAAALAAVGRFGEAARYWIGPLQTVLSAEGSERDRGAAAASLVSLAALNPALLPDLLVRLRSDAPEVRQWIAARAGQHTELAASFIPALLERLEDTAEYANVTEEAARSLSEYGEVMRPHVTRLARCLTVSPDTDFLRSVLEALHRLGEVAATAVPAIRRFLETSYDLEAGLVAVYTLSNIPGDGRALALVAALRHEEPDVRERAALTLKELDDEAAEVIPDICRALQSLRGDLTLHTSIRDDDDEVSGGDDERDLFDLECDIREDLLDLLGKLGKKAVGAIPTIVRYIDDEVEDVRIAAVEALVAIGPRARDALRQAARSEYEDVVEIAEAALDDLDDRR